MRNLYNKNSGSYPCDLQNDLRANARVPTNMSSFPDFSLTYLG